MSANRLALIRVGLALAVAAFSTACSFFVTPTPYVLPSATPNSEPPPVTDTPEPPPPTDTPAAMEPEATDTPAQPLPTPVDKGRVIFDQGTTEAAVSGELDAGEAHAYTMGVGAGQLLDISTVSAGELTMLIVGADGRALRLWAEPFHRGIVDDTQDYIVTIRADEAATSYGLNIIIPQRVVFETGATSAQLQAEIPANRAHHLVIRALGGQTMTIDTTTTSGEILTVVYGADGMVLQTDHGGAPDFTGKLPSTQDYLIGMRALYGDPATVVINIEIPPPD